MAFKKFSLLIIVRTLLAMASLLALSHVINLPGYQATTLLLTVLLICQLVELTRFVAKTNKELARFFEAVQHADFSQRFEFDAVGSGFDELGQMFTNVLARIQQERSKQEESRQHLKAIVEHVPVPLLSIHSNDKVSLWNNSARQLFGKHAIANTRDLAHLDKQFYAQLSVLSIGEQRLINFNLDQMELKLLVSCTEFISATRREALFSLQDIQSELASTQLQAWQELVSVLTHEIMNSITPVASLAKTTVDMVEDIQLKTQNTNTLTPQLLSEINEELDDTHDAVLTVARRSENLTQFVSSYRQLTKLPAPNKKRVEVSQLFAGVANLTTQTRQSKGIKFIQEITPKTLDFDVDHQMIEQVLINLLKNAEQAVEDQASPTITMSAFLNPRGHVVIQVADNGTGIDELTARQIFVPFFTTKKEGSGVGLALTRQIMLAHGGKVTLQENDNKGATFRLTF